MSRLSSRPVTALEQFGLGGIKERVQHPTVDILLQGARLVWDTSGGMIFKEVFEFTLHLKQKWAYFLILSKGSCLKSVSIFTYRYCVSFCGWHSGFPSPSQISFVLVLLNHYRPNAYPVLGSPIPCPDLTASGHSKWPVCFFLILL